jgi:acyl-CoA reductase-like NAD-dependent aldehyde dehydrogenase
MTSLETLPNSIASHDLLEVLSQLADTQPKTALAIVRALGAAEMSELDGIARRSMETLAFDSRLDAEVDATVFRAHTAQDVFANWTESRVDALLRGLAEAFARLAESFAAATVKETGLGNVADKTLKNRFASLTVCESLSGKVGEGAIASDATLRVAELASPVGVVFAVLPVTNPVETAIFKTLIALKARNAVILSFHHDAMRVGQMAVELIQAELAAHGAPTDLVQTPVRVGRKTTERFMRHPGVALILATGGAGLVRAAYSSGKPAIGVGPGNAPAWISADANVEWAAQCVVWSKSFDNGLICGAEHSLVVDTSVAQAFVRAMEENGAAVLTSDERDQFTRMALDPDSGVLRRELVGQSAAAIAAVVGIRRPFPIEIIVMDSDAQRPDAFSMSEKLAPVLSLFRVRGEDEALKLCESLLRIVGAGHTAIIHSASSARVERFARVMPAGRILVNTPGAQGCCGMTTGLECSLTLGCGTFGGNSTTDNITFRHLINVKRIAYNLD